MVEPSPYDTVELLARARGGGVEALDAFCRRALPRVKQIVMARLGAQARDAHLVDDLVQESILDTVRALPRFEPRSEAGLRNWLAAIVANNISDRFKRERTRKRGDGAVHEFGALQSSFLAASLVDRSARTASQIAIGREHEEELWTAFLELSDSDRRIIDLRALCEMEYDEIASHLGIAQSSARAGYSRAVERLMEKVG